MSLRIAMFSWESLHSIAVGGLAAHVSELAEALHHRGHEVHVFTRSCERHGRYDCIDGVHYHRCAFESSPDFFTYVNHMGNILYVGRLAWQKGPDLLLETVPDVLRRHADAKFVFVGDGEMRPSLQARAAELGLFKSVRFAGHKDGSELVRLFKSADMVCVPSRNEPFGIVVLEAWSAVRPVVVTRNGGPSEFVRDQETGFTVFADRESIGWGLGTALADAERAQAVGHNGRREVESRFSWEAIAAETEDVYGSLCAA